MITDCKNCTICNQPNPCDSCKAGAPCDELCDCDYYDSDLYEQIIENSPEI
jgi:hypothetical protein